MLHSLKALPPESIMVVGLLWILREVFAFVSKMFLNMKKKNDYDAEKDIASALQKVSINMEHQVELIRAMLSELKTIREKVYEVHGQAMARH